MRHRISFRLGIALTGAVVLTLLASVVGLVFLQQIQTAQKQVHDVAMPNMEEAFSISRTGGDLIAVVPGITAVQTIEELNLSSEDAMTIKTKFREQLDSVNRFDLSESHQSELVASGGVLLENIDRVEGLVEERISRTLEISTLSTNFYEIATTLRHLLITAIDKQRFFVMVGYTDRNTPPVSREEHFSSLELTRLHHLVELRQYTTQGSQSMYNALNVATSAQLETLKDEFESTEDGVFRVLNYLQEDILYETLYPLYEQLYEIGLEAEGMFAVKSQLLSINGEIDSVFRHSRSLGDQLVQILEEAVRSAQIESVDAAQSSAAAVNTGRVLLIIVNIVSIVGALFIAFVYVGKNLLVRLDKLSERMRAMAEGNLEAVIVIDGPDEIGDMQHALEVFRKNALEVQRLNLVEHLADELSKKNEELESTNDELQQAQGQIVMREKLAALGELTAGVAHEIRNPMNFIKNFSESSQDLLEEMLEEILDPSKREPPGSEIDESLVREISDDLIANFKRIMQHTNRANRIINDMLKMGRDVHEFHETDINELIREHAKLSFHSARAQDTSFQLDIQYELDDSIPPTRVVPQDFGRLIINLVSNSGFACNEKRKTLLEEDSQSSYIPTLLIKTENYDDGIIITVRDNGTGIPDSVIERIFNPFFTTKPTDQGTGLGLSLCNDIVGQHGGTLEVSSEPGEWTQMEIDLPSDPAQFME